MLAFDWLGRYDIESESLGCLDNKALNRSVLIARVGQSPDGRILPLYPALVFTN